MMTYGKSLGLKRPICRIKPVGLCRTKYKNGLSSFSLGLSTVSLIREDDNFSWDLSLYDLVYSDDAREFLWGLDG